MGEIIISGVIISPNGVRVRESPDVRARRKGGALRVNTPFHLVDLWFMRWGENWGELASGGFVCTKWARKELCYLYFPD